MKYSSEIIGIIALSIMIAGIPIIEAVVYT